MLRVYFPPRIHPDRFHGLLKLPDTLWYGTLIAVGYFDIAFRADGGGGCALDTMMHQLAHYKPAHPISNQATQRRDASPLLVLRFVEFGTLRNYQAAIETLLRGPIAMQHGHLIKVPTLLIEFITTNPHPRAFAANATNCILTWVQISDWSVVYIMFDAVKCQYLMITSASVQAVNMRIEQFQSNQETLCMAVCKQTSLPSSYMTLHVRVLECAKCVFLI